MNVNQKCRAENHFFVEMVSFHELQELFLFSHAQGYLDEEELLLLYEEYLLQLYSDAIAAQGPALDNCFGFVDGTVRPICRPAEHQRAVCNGHKRVHALKFPSFPCPPQWSDRSSLWARR